MVCVCAHVCVHVCVWDENIFNTDLIVIKKKLVYY